MPLLSYLFFCVFVQIFLLLEKIISVFYFFKSSETIVNKGFQQCLFFIRILDFVFYALLLGRKSQVFFGEIDEKKFFTKKPYYL